MTDNLPAKPKRLKRSYTEEQVERGLAEVVIAGGNTRLASSRLDGEIPHQTLDTWVYSTHRERYVQTRTRLLPVIQDTIAAGAEARALELDQLEHKAVGLLEEKIHGLPAKELAGALRNISTAKAINIDKAQLLRGNPTSIVEKRTGEEIVDSLASKYPHLAAPINGTAEEIEDAQLVA